MKNIIQRTLLTLVLLSLTTFNVSAAIFNGVSDDTGITQTQIGSEKIKTALSGSGITHTDNAGDLIIKYVNFLLPYLTLAAFLGFVVAGIFYVTAYGNEDQVGKAKNIMIWSAVGLILVIMSYTIVQFVTSELLNAL